MESLNTPKTQNLLNLLNNKIKNIRGESFQKRKIMANVFLKRNEKESIETKSRSIKWNFDAIKKNLSLINHEIINVNSNIKKRGSSQLRNIKFLMLSNELWSKKHYQKVIEDSFLLPTEELFQNKINSKAYRVLMKYFQDYFEKIKNKENKKLFFFSLLIEAFQKIDSFQNINDQEIETIKLEILDKINAKTNIVSKKSSLIENYKENNNIEKKEQVSKGVSLEEMVKKMEFLGKVEKTQNTQKKKEFFFEKLIQSNIANSEMENFADIEKNREIRNKLISTYQFSKHKRGRNPFQMLLASKKEEKEEEENNSPVLNILKKTKSNKINKNYHFMLPIKNPKQKEKIDNSKLSKFTFETPKNLSIDKKENNEFESTRAKSRTMYTKRGENIDYIIENSLKKDNIKSGVKLKLERSLSAKYMVNPITNEKKIKENQTKLPLKKKYYKNITSCIIKECDGFINDDVNLKRQIEIGINFTKIEKMIINNSKFKEAKILLEIDQFEKKTREKLNKERELSILKKKKVKMIGSKKI